MMDGESKVRSRAKGEKSGRSSKRERPENDRKSSTNRKPKHKAVVRDSDSSFIQKDIEKQYDNDGPLQTPIAVKKTRSSRCCFSFTSFVAFLALLSTVFTGIGYVQEVGNTMIARELDPQHIARFERFRKEVLSRKRIRPANIRPMVREPDVDTESETEYRRDIVRQVYEGDSSATSEHSIIHSLRERFVASEVDPVLPSQFEGPNLFGKVVVDVAYEEAKEWMNDILLSWIDNNDLNFNSFARRKIKEAKSTGKADSEVDADVISILKFKKYLKKEKKRMIN